VERLAAALGRVFFGLLGFGFLAEEFERLWDLAFLLGVDRD